MKTVLLVLPILLSFSLHAQYYYNDIIGTLEMNRQMKNYVTQKVTTVSVAGYDPRGSKATNFSEYQEVKENGRALKVSTITDMNKSVIYSRFDEESRLISQTDSSSAIESVTSYEYDVKGRITGIRNSLKDPANDFSQTEVHLWTYHANDKPASMWRIINGTDSLEIRFTADEFGNAGDEKTYRKGRETAIIYYYYDELGRMTDIVRYNSKAKKLLPDMLIEYDDKNRVIQKITTTSSLTLGYLIWRYVYDAKGLKSKEALFNDEKQLTGKIEYSYTFSG